MIAFLPTLVSLLSTPVVPVVRDSLELWIPSQALHSYEKILENIGPSDGHPGAVIASPSRVDPNYYDYWVRDGAIVMSELVFVAQGSNRSRASEAMERLRSFAAFSRLNQLLPTQGGIGEPKYHVDGSEYKEPWGRPQNDGPALRALTLISLAHHLQNSFPDEHFLTDLYDSKFPTQSVIKKDLEYTSHQWKNDTFDLWEEVAGDHFFTRILQREALQQGAKLATTLKDPGAAKWYLGKATEINRSLEAHWDSLAETVVPTLNPHFTEVRKPSQLDISVILGVLRGEVSADSSFSVLDSRVLSTATLLERAFEGLYLINKKFDALAIGRYPEDFYYGGNPWYLATLAMAEFSHSVANSLQERGLFLVDRFNQKWVESLGDFRWDVGFKISKKDLEWPAFITSIRKKGDKYFETVRQFTPDDGSLSEQISRWDGTPVGARDLTWSYAAFLSAARARTPSEHR